MRKDSFEDKEHPKTTGRRGYENGSRSEIDVSKPRNWAAFEIYSRTGELLAFMRECWNLQFDEERSEEPIGISFVKDGREVQERPQDVAATALYAMTKRRIGQ